MTIKYDWDVVIARFRFQKERLQLTTEDLKDYIKKQYRKTFKKLSDSEIIELGQSMANAKDKEMFLSQSQGKTTIVTEDNEVEINPYQGKYAVLKKGVANPFEGEKSATTSRVLVDLKLTKNGFIRGRQSGMKKYLEVRLLDVEIHEEKRKARSVPTIIQQTN